MSSLPKTVCVESPFRNPLPEVPLIGELYRDYLHDCLRDSLSRGEAPFAGHAYLPFVLDDGDEAERKRGIDCHLAWLKTADAVAVYVDFGLSPGMLDAMRAKEYFARSVETWSDVAGYVRGFIYGWEHGADDRPVDEHFDRGIADGCRRDPTLFRP